MSIDRPARALQKVKHTLSAASKPRLIEREGGKQLNDGIKMADQVASDSYAQALSFLRRVQSLDELLSPFIP